MKNSSLVPQLFDQTMVNVQRLEAFLKGLPVYYQAALQDGAREPVLELLSHADEFDYAFRCYLRGKSRTMHQVYARIREFQQADKISSWHMMACCLELIRNVLLHFEAYELMPRYEQARKRIEARFHIDLDGCLNVAKMRAARSQTQREIDQ